MPTSKKRRKAREWMQTHVEETKRKEVRAHQEGVFQGREEIKRDGGRLFPKGGEFPNERGGFDVVKVIDQFPTYRDGPVFRVPMPTAPLSLMDFRSHNLKSIRREDVTFMCIEHALTKHDERGNRLELRWFTWQPTRGDEKLEGQTSALFTGMGKLRFVQHTLDHVKYVWGNSPTCTNCGHRVPQPNNYGELQRCAELTQECFDELRRRLGDLAPIPDDDERRDAYRYGYGQLHAGSRL